MYLIFWTLLQPIHKRIEKEMVKPNKVINVATTDIKTGVLPESLLNLSEKLKKYNKCQCNAQLLLKYLYVVPADVGSFTVVIKTDGLGMAAGDSK